MKTQLRFPMYRSTLLAVGAVLFGIQLTEPAQASPTFSTVALTGVSDACNLTPVGGTTLGDATAVAPPALLVESCGGPGINVNASADASAGIAEGDVALSDGAYVLGRLHTAASSTGPANAHARAIFFELLNIVPTSGFSDGYFYVTATYTIDGTLSGQADAAGELQLVSALGSDDEFNCAGDFGCPNPAVSEFSITDSVPVLTSAPFLSVQTFLDVSAGSSFPFSDTSGAADYSNTGILSLTLPDGFTFTSDVNNGVLSPAANVPEPATIWLYGVALAGLGLLRLSKEFGPVTKIE